jgi:glycine/D-amino acid oxidase-like deaminating enzyme
MFMNRREFMKRLGIGGAVAAGGLVLPPLIAETFGPDGPETDDPREPSFWELDAGPPPHVPRLSRDIETDVAVIGAGITGLSAARTLKESRPDLEVCVLDSHRPCSGASSRNSAHLRGEYHAWKSILRSEGPEAAAEWNGFTQRGLESVLEFLKANNIECDLRQEPFLWVGTEAGTRGLENLADMMKHVRPDQVRFLKGQEFRKRCGTGFYSCGIEDNNNYVMHPGKMMKGFLERVTAKGVAVYEHSAALEIINTDSFAETNIVKTPGGSVAASKVLFATNAYTPRLNGLLSSRMVPIVLATVATEPLSESQRRKAGFEWDFMLEHRLLSRSMGHTPDNRAFLRGILGYSAFNSCCWKSAARGFRRIEAEMKERMPWTRGLRVTHRWLGPVAMTYSSCPIAGPLPKKGQYVAAGYSGSGMVDGFYHGRLVALQMLGVSHPDFRYLRGPSGWIPPEPHRAIGAKTFFFVSL